MAWYSISFTLGGALLHEVSGFVHAAASDDEAKDFALERFGRDPDYRPGDTVEMGEYGGSGDFVIIVNAGPRAVGRWTYAPDGEPIWTPASAI